MDIEISQNSFRNYFTPLCAHWMHKIFLPSLAPLAKDGTNWFMQPFDDKVLKLYRTWSHLPTYYVLECTYVNWIVQNRFDFRYLTFISLNWQLFAKYKLMDIFFKNLNFQLGPIMSALGVKTVVRFCYEIRLSHI